ADGWYRSGDIGRMVDGYLYISDRLNDMIISGGENVYPAEVERVVNTHPDVLEAAAFAIPHPKWGEAVACAIRPRPGCETDEKALIAYSRERLAHYKCPAKIVFMDDFPRTASGKVQRNVLKAPFW
ncbi:MAG: fatty acid--CoA ligase, partial [Caenibius sp.]